MLTYIQGKLRSRRELSTLKAEITKESQGWWYAQGFNPSNDDNVVQMSIMPA
jgi:hypothetical protein